MNPGAGIETIIQWVAIAIVLSAVDALILRFSVAVVAKSKLPFPHALKLAAIVAAVYVAINVVLSQRMDATELSIITLFAVGVAGYCVVGQAGITVAGRVPLPQRKVATIAILHFFIVANILVVPPILLLWVDRLK